GRVILGKAPIQVEDVQVLPDGALGRHAREQGFRTVLGVPLLVEGEPIGELNIRRTEVAPFTEAEVRAAQSFADFAATAIERARLSEELTEALEHQTATAAVLEIISSSPTEIQPVLQAIIEKAASVC